MTISSFRDRQAAVFDDPAGAGLAVLAGVSVPLVAFGKAVMAVPLVPAALLALILVFRGDARVRLQRLALSPEGVVLGLFFLFALISALLSDHLAKALFTWARSAVFVGVAAAMSVALADQVGRATLACKALLVAAAVTLLYVCGTIYVDDTLFTWLTGRRFVFEGAPSRLKAFGSTAVCLLPALLLSARIVGLHLAYSFPAIIAAVFLAIWLGGSQTSEAGLLGVICASSLVALVLLVGRLRKPYRVATIAFLLLAGLSIGVLVTAKLPSLTEIHQDQFTLPKNLIDPHRQLIWGFTMEATGERPLFGHGPNTINLIEGAEEVIEFLDPTSSLVAAELIPSHPHNWIYEISSETGLAGLTALVLALLLVLRRLAILALDGAWAGWAAVALFAAFWGSSLVNFSIWAAWWQLTFLVLLAIVLAAASAEKPGRPT